MFTNIGKIALLLLAGCSVRTPVLSPEDRWEVQSLGDVTVRQEEALVKLESQIHVLTTMKAEISPQAQQVIDTLGDVSATTEQSIIRLDASIAKLAEVDLGHAEAGRDASTQTGFINISGGWATALATGALSAVFAYLWRRKCRHCNELVAKTKIL